MSLPAVTFRPCTPDDLPLLARWMAQPHVAQYWREDAELADVEERYQPCLDGRDPTELFVQEADGAAVGLFQRYLVADNEEWATTLRGTGQPDVVTAIGIDYLIGEPALTGRGLGTAAIITFTRLALARYPTASLMAVAVAQGNIASWRALEKAGYDRCWEGELVSDDPSDEGPMYLYRFPSGR